MADLMGVMLKSLGVNPDEIMKTAGSMQEMVAEIHAMLGSIAVQNEIIIMHLADGASYGSPIAQASADILTRKVNAGELTCAGYSGDSVSGD